MSYSVVYTGPGFEPVDGDQIASGKGWLNWVEMVEDKEDCPQCQQLAEEGWVGGDDDDSLDDVEHELEQLVHDDDSDFAAVSAALLAAVRGKPNGATCITVTDGVESEDDDLEEDEDGDE